MQYEFKCVSVPHGDRGDEELNRHGVLGRDVVPGVGGLVMGQNMALEKVPVLLLLMRRTAGTPHERVAGG